MISAESRASSISKIAKNPALLNAFRRHLEEIIKGEVFGGSTRSQQFLRYVVERAIEGDYDSLKERMIGVQLFHRSASYDTGEDAVVRVTASDVRKRLQQHYGRSGDTEFRVDLLPGSYIPEVACFLKEEQSSPAAEESSAPVEAMSPDAAANEKLKKRFSPVLLWLAVPAALLLVVCGFWAGTRFSRASISPLMAAGSPLSVLFESGRTLQIVASDPDFASLQDITGHGITLSDYANEKYLPDSAPLSAEMKTFCLKYLRGSRAADVDLPIVADIVSVANTRGSRFAIRTARMVHAADFETDEDFVLLGSPVANPWVDMFRDQLDFRFRFMGNTGAELIENARQARNESAVYSPVGGGFEIKPPTRTTYAVVAFFQNPHHRGHVLILAGIGAEATAAAAHVAMNNAELSNAFQKCPHPAGGSLRDFELLLGVNVMAGSPIRTDVISCHAIQ